MSRPAATVRSAAVGSASCPLEQAGLGSRPPACVVPARPPRSNVPGASPPQSDTPQRSPSAQARVPTFVRMLSAYVLMWRACFASSYSTATVGAAQPARNAMSITLSSSSRVLNISGAGAPVAGSSGMTLRRPSYRWRPTARHSGSTNPSCPLSTGRPMVSLASPHALVTGWPAGTQGEQGARWGRGATAPHKGVSRLAHTAAREGVTACTQNRVEPSR